MAVRPVMVLPERCLTQRSDPVVDLDAAALQLVRDMVDTMRSRVACVGLAAPQIGVGTRAFVVDVSGHPKAISCHGEVVLFNPVLLAAEGPVIAREGCLSVPDLTGDVSRATLVTVSGTTPEGDLRTLTADAFEARALLHELDHLDGLLFLDRVASHRSLFRRKVYR